MPHFHFTKAFPNLLNKLQSLGGSEEEKAKIRLWNSVSRAALSFGYWVQIEQHPSKPIERRHFLEQESVRDASTFL